MANLFDSSNGRRADQRGSMTEGLQRQASAASKALCGGETSTAKGGQQSDVVGEHGQRLGRHQGSVEKRDDDDGMQ